jgi:hypothetical protein
VLTISQLLLLSKRSKTHIYSTVETITLDIAYMSESMLERTSQDIVGEWTKLINFKWNDLLRNFCFEVLIKKSFVRLMLSAYPSYCLTALHHNPVAHGQLVVTLSQLGQATWGTPAGQITEQALCKFTHLCCSSSHIPQLVVTFLTARQCSG